MTHIGRATLQYGSYSWLGNVRRPSNGLSGGCTDTAFIEKGWEDMTKKPNWLAVQFANTESAGGILLLIAAVLALLIANSPFYPLYDLLLDTPVEVRIGELQIEKPLLLWINDGLMAVFFFLVGLELKREVLVGELAHPSQVVLPAVGAVGGMLVPALFYVGLNWGDSMAMQGWAIPAATDIAFALGLLALLGTRVPVSIKVFLASLAIFDDIGAIVIIAVFYTSKISYSALLLVMACLPVLYWLNRKNVETKSLYIAIGLIMWASMLKSGVHATLAGVVLALFIPLKTKRSEDESPLRSMEHDLQPTVSYFVLPLFAFANAGITLTGVSPDYILHPVPLGVALGLFVGKQLGIFAFCWLALQLRWAAMPRGMNWRSLYGTAALCGVGFTMSLFIGSLAFEETQIDNVFDERVGIILGSLFSGVVGLVVLHKTLPRGPHSESQP